MSLYRVGYLAIPLALLASTAIGFAQSTTTTTTTTIEKRAPLTLSPQQRTVIYRTVTRERRVAAPRADMAVRVGEPVPPAVVLSPLPETVYAEVPAVRPLRYFYANNQLVLVDPATSEVVEIIGQ